MVAANVGGKSVRFVGYCDRTDCAEVAGRVLGSSALTVLAAGETPSTQAVFNADAESAAIVADDQMRSLRRIVWRGVAAEPVKIAAEILK